jgi:subtilase family serine protease
LLPDLTPTNIWFSDNNPLIGQAIDLFANVANIGGGQAASVQTSFYDNDQLIGNVTLTSSLGKGASQTVSLSHAFSPAGRHNVCVVVDPENLVKETDEENNEYCRVLDVHLPQPDLTLSSAVITFSNDTPTVGDVISVSATVLNIGETGADNVTVTFFGDDSQIGQESLISFIMSGGQVAADVSWNATPEGWHQIKVIVDRNDAVLESNENNNVGTRCIYVCPRIASDPCVYAEDVVFSNTCPAEGASVKIYATVHNIGEAEAQNVMIAFYIDDVQLGPPQISQSIPIGGEDTVSTNWIASQAGSHVVRVRVDVATESNKNNNAATRAIIVGLHDLAVADIVKMKTVVGQGFVVSINVTLMNLGNYVETFDVTLYANSTAVKTESITLGNNSSANVTFKWNTTSFPRGNWTLSFYVWPVAHETETQNNFLTKDWIRVCLVGDISGKVPGVPDGKVDMRDIGAVARLFGVSYPNPLYVSNYDIDDNSKIDMKDIAVVARHFGDKET